MFFRTNFFIILHRQLHISYQLSNALLKELNRNKITKNIIAMKKDIHPENYRPVAFKDLSNGDVFVTRSTVNTKDTIEVDGETLPLVKLEISSSSHPFFTGKSKMVDTAGRVDKFVSRYGNRNKK